MPKPTASQAAKSPMLDVARDLYLAIQCDAAKSALDECGASRKRARIVRQQAVTALMSESRVMEATLVASHGESWYSAQDTAWRMIAETTPLGNLAHVGDILRCSWGYDQTNVDFYQVLKVSKSSVRIRQIRSQIVGDQGGPTENVIPISGSFVAPHGDRDDKEVRSESGAMRRVSVSGDTYSVRISSYSNAYLWDGKPCYQTGWGYGH